MTHEVLLAFEQFTFQLGSFEWACLDGSVYRTGTVQFTYIDR